MSCIIKNYLYLGGASDVTAEFITKNNIRTIINVAIECDDIVENIRYFKYDLYDDFVDISRHFAEVVGIIKNGFKFGGVLVHCKAGISRSASFVVAYMIKEIRMSVVGALEYIGRTRHVSPNPCFMRQLMHLEMTTLGTNSFAPKIDDYTIRCILAYAKLCRSMYGIVNEFYIETGKDVSETYDKVRDFDDKYSFLYLLF